MAVHNARRFLEPAIRSVLQQTWRDFELLVVDDGSTDQTPGILARLASQDPRLRVITHANMGLTRSLNVALRAARGELIARMDGDDLCTPDRFETQVAFMDAHPQVVLLGGAYELIDEYDRLLTVQTPPTDDASLQQQCLDGTTPICHPLAMYRRGAVMRVGLYDESYDVGQDLDLWLRLGEIGQMAAVKRVLLKYRMHASSVSERRQQRQVDNMRRAVESAGRRRGVATRFKGDAGWRAMGSRQSRLRQQTRFGWWAWNSGENRTARAYGWRAIACCPWRLDGYKLLYAASFKKAKNAAQPR